MLKRLALLVLAIVLMSVTVPTQVWARADKAASDDVIHDKVMQKLAGDPIVKGGGLEIDVKGGVHVFVRVVRRRVPYHCDPIAKLSGEAHGRIDAGMCDEADDDELLNTVPLELQIQISVGKAA